MNKELDTSKCLELTTCIVLEAMRSGRLDVASSQSVADYFLVVYQSVADCASLEPSDLETIIKRLSVKRVEVMPER